MNTDPVRHDCSVRVYSGGSYRSQSCSKPGKVQRPVARRVYPDPIKKYDEETFSFTEERLEPVTVVEQKWFCGAHDPVATEDRAIRRRAEQSREWKAKQAREDAYRDAAALMAQRRQDVIDAAKKVASPCATSDDMRHLQNALKLLGAK